VNELKGHVTILHSAVAIISLEARRLECGVYIDIGEY